MPKRSPRDMREAIIACLKDERNMEYVYSSPMLFSILSLLDSDQIPDDVAMGYSLGAALVAMDKNAERYHAQWLNSIKKGS